MLLLFVVGSEKIDLGENIILYKIEKKCERTERKQLLNAYESAARRGPAYKGGPPARRNRLGSTRTPSNRKRSGSRTEPKRVERPGRGTQTQPLNANPQKGSVAVAIAVAHPGG